MEVGWCFGGDEERQDEKPYISDNSNIEQRH